MPLPPFVRTFRDAELSLWQAAVYKTYGDPAPPATAAVATAGDAGDSLSQENPFLRMAERVGSTVETIRSATGSDPIEDIVPNKPVLTAADLPSPQAVLASFETFSLVAISLARRVGNDPDLFMRLLNMRYDDLDPRWAQVALNYVLFVKFRHQGITGYKHTPPAEAVIDGRLVEHARVALIGDWGTGTDIAEAVLSQLAAKKPDVVIHLGDVYYAGAEQQFAKFRQEFQDILKFKDPGGPLVLTMSGNHDMYSGGGPYYETLSDFGQAASYFCLRNANWQFVAMDTGLTNSAIKLTFNPDVSDDPHGIDEGEAEWVRDKVRNAGGRNTILLSHHQPFSAFEKLTAGGPANTDLLGQMGEVLGGVCRWYWGHEHDLIIYLDTEQYQGVVGRCIGHGAIPMDVATYRLDALRPKARDGWPIPKVDDTVQLDLMTENPHFYNHGYVIIDLDGPKATATHYQASDPEKVLLVENLP
jgi:hypothetical protein